MPRAFDLIVIYFLAIFWAAESKYSIKIFNFKKFKIVYQFINFE